MSLSVSIFYRTPKDKLLIALRKGQAERVSAMLDQFPEELDANMNADSADNKLLHRAARQDEDINSKKRVLQLIQLLNN